MGRRGSEGSLADGFTLLFHNVTPVRHIAVMLRKRPGEGMTTGTIGHEVDEVVLLRIHDGLDRSLTRIRDGGRRQTVNQVGVTGRLVFPVRPVQGPAKRTGS